MIDFETQARNAKIQGLSIQVGELFAEMYRDKDDNVLEALEAYKSLRRLLPLNEYGRHVGHRAAGQATQGYSRF